MNDSSLMILVHDLQLRNHYFFLTALKFKTFTILNRSPIPLLGLGRLFSTGPLCILDFSETSKLRQMLEGSEAIAATTSATSRIHSRHSTPMHEHTPTQNIYYVTQKSNTFPNLE